MSRFRTDVENLFLSEMVEEDRAFIMSEDTVDDIIPVNTVGLFDDTSSGDDDLEDLLDDENNLLDLKQVEEEEYKEDFTPVDEIQPLPAEPTVSEEDDIDDYDDDEEDYDDSDVEEAMMEGDED